MADNAAADALASAFGLSTDSFLAPVEHPLPSGSAASDPTKAAKAMHSSVDALSMPPSLPSFVSASGFEGHLEGFVFKRGTAGLGYYRDVGLAAASAALPSVPTSSVAARRAPAARALAARGAAAPSQPRDFRKGFRFGGGTGERAFRAFCTTAHLNGTLAEDEVEALYSTVAQESAEPARADAMVRVLEDGLRGQEVTIVGATGRTPRGWWGDGTIGRVLPLPCVFDETRPELLPVRVTLRSATAEALGSCAIPSVMDVGIRAVNCRLRPRSAGTHHCTPASAPHSPLYNYACVERYGARAMMM